MASQQRTITRTIPLASKYVPFARKEEVANEPVSIFTYEERTQKRWTVAQAIAAARTIMVDRYEMTDHVIPAFYIRNATEKITLEELNEISAEILAANYL